MKSFKKEDKKDYLMITLLILGGIFLFFLGNNLYSKNFITSTDSFVEGKLISVNSKIAGFAIHVYAQNNQEVNKGDLLIEIDPSDYEIKLQKAENELRDLKTKLNIAQRDINENERQDDSNNPFSKNSFKGYEKLYGEGIIEVKPQEQTLVKNQNPQKVKKDNEEEEELDPKEIAERIKQLESEIEQIKLDLSNTKIFASQDGIISANSTREGDYIEVGQTVLSIIPKRVWVSAKFTEEQISDISEGQAVIVKISKYPTKKFKGVVDNIDRSEKSNEKIPVRIMFTEDYSEYNIAPGTAVTTMIKRGK